MRVLVVANDFPDEERPQAGIFILRQVEALARAQWEAAVVRFIPWAPALGARWQSYRRLPPHYTINGLEVNVVRVFLLPRFWLMQTLGWQTRSFLAARIAEFRPHVIHVHQAVPTGMIALNHGVPVVLTAHGSDAYDYPFRNKVFQATARHVLRSVDRVVAVSQFVAGKLHELGAQRVDVVYNGADPTVFFARDRHEARRTFGIPSTRKVVLFAGYVGESKGVLDLVAALKRLSDVKPLLVIAGSGPEQRRVELECATGGVECRFLGTLDQPRLGEIMGAANVVVLPSHREGLPAVICEALLSERAVVASRVGGIPEIVQDGVTGRLVEPKNVDQLTRVLRDVLSDTAEELRLARAGRTFAEAHLTWAENARAYGGLFASLVSEGGNRNDSPHGNT